MEPAGLPQHRDQRVTAWIPPLLWMLMISWLSSEGFSGSWSGGLLAFWVRYWNLPVTLDAVQMANLILRKGAHFAEFFVLGVLLSRAIWQHTPKSEKQGIGWVLLAGGLYALGDECRQAFTSSRGASPVDVLVDLAGVAASQLWWSRTRRPLAGGRPRPEA